MKNETHDIIGYVLSAKQYRDYMKRNDRDESLLLEFDGDPDIYLGVIVSTATDGRAKLEEEKQGIDWERVETITDEGHILGLGMPRLISTGSNKRNEDDY